MNNPQTNTKNLGETLIAQEKYKEAISCFEEIIEKEENNPEHYYYLGLAYLLNQDTETAESIWMSILLESDDFETSLDHLLTLLDQQGTKFNQQRKLKLAFIIYQKVDELLENVDNTQEKYGFYYFRIGEIYNAFGQTDQAIHSLHKSITIAQIKECYDYLAGIYYKIGQLDKLEMVAKQEIEIHPNYPGGYVNLFGAYLKSGQVEKAIEVSEQGIKKCPKDLVLKIKNYFLLPSLYNKADDIKLYRQRFIDNLDKFCQEIYSLDLTDKQNLDSVLSALQNNVNFELAYQSLNHKELQQKYGQIIHYTMSKTNPEWVQPKSIKSTEDRKIKVGYLSMSMKHHIVARLTFGWLKNHDRSKLEVYSYYIGDKIDDVTENYRQNSDFFYHTFNWHQLCQQILSDDLDILVFLEIGMNAKMTMLSSLRLAPIQCTTWAHPETSGSVSIDYFLSSELMEPDNGQEHYCEKLIRLPNIGVCTPKPPIPQDHNTRAFFQLPEDKILYFCAQSIFKYLPYHDYIFPSIAQKVPDSKFIFLKRPNLSLANQFKERLKLAFDNYNLNIDDYCIFYPTVTHENFMRLNLISDVFLDSLGWSGGGTTLDALACSLPVVTCPGEFMRGRHSYGILRMLGVEETIAYSEKQYIDIAVRLGVDKEWREEIREKINANHSNLYDDLECVRGLEKFYQDVVKHNK